MYSLYVLVHSCSSKWYHVKVAFNAYPRTLHCYEAAVAKPILAVLVALVYSHAVTGTKPGMSGYRCAELAYN